MDLGGQPAPAGLQDTAVGIGEGGKIRADEDLDVLLGGLESGVPGGGGLTERGSALIRLSGVSRSGIAQEHLAGRRVGDAAVGGEESVSLASREGVAPDGIRQPDLIRAREGCDGRGDGQGQTAGVEAHGQLGNQVTGQGEPAIDPGLLASHEFGDGGGRELFFRRDRRDDTGLVHGAGGLLGRIGDEESGLGRGAGDRLDDDGDPPDPLTRPEGQALESVEDFEGPVLDGHHANRQRRQIGLAVGPPAAQRGETSPKPIDRDFLDEAHERLSSKGRS
jgi:hypothetical protein